MPRDVNESSLSQPCHESQSPGNARHPSRQEERGLSPVPRETIAIDQRSPPPPEPQQKRWAESRRIQKSFNLSSSSSLRRVILTPSRSSQVLMRSVSGLGMEDPVFGVPLNPSSQTFDDLSLSDLSADMQDLVTVASDPTADLHTGMGFHIACLKTLCISLSPSQLTQVKEVMHGTKTQDDEFQMALNSTDFPQGQKIPPNSMQSLDEMLRGRVADESQRSSLDPPKRVVRKDSVRTDSFLQEEPAYSNKIKIPDSRNQVNESPPKRKPRIKLLKVPPSSSPHPQEPEVTAFTPPIKSARVLPSYETETQPKAKVPEQTPEEPRPEASGCIPQDSSPVVVDQPPKLAQRVESGSWIPGTDDNEDLQKQCKEEVNLEDIVVSPRKDGGRDAPLDLHASIDLFDDDDVPVAIREFKESRNHVMESLTQSMPELSHEHRTTEETEWTKQQVTSPKKLGLAMELSKTRQDMTTLRRTNPRRAPALLEMALTVSGGREGGRRRLPADVAALLPGISLLQDGTLKHRRELPARSSGVLKDVEFVPSSRDAGPQGLPHFPKSSTESSASLNQLLRKGRCSSPRKAKAGLVNNPITPINFNPSKTAISPNQRGASPSLSYQLSLEDCMLETPIQKNLSKRSGALEPEMKRSLSFIPDFADDGESTIARNEANSSEEASSQTSTLSPPTSESLVPTHYLSVGAAVDGGGGSTPTLKRWEAFSVTEKSQRGDLPPKPKYRGGSSNQLAAGSRHSQLSNTNHTCRSSDSTVSLPMHRKWDGSLASSNSTERHTPPQRTSESTFVAPNHRNYTTSENSWSTWISEEQSVGSGLLSEEASLSIGGRLACGERRSNDGLK